MKNNNYYLGFDEVSGELNSKCDKTLKNVYLAHFNNVFKCKASRVWLSTKEIIKIKENDEIEFILEGLVKFHNYIEALRRAGVEKFCLLDWGFVYPYGYKASDAAVVPDPKREPEMYRRFMLLQQKVRYEIANNFSFIQYFESTNEPDGEGGTFFHKNGYNGSPTDKEHIFTLDEVEDIILDLNYFENLGVKEAYKNNKMLLPSFCNFDYGPKFLDDIYNKIESGNYPTIGNIKSNKIEGFFELLNLHPYNLVSTEINEDWLLSQRRIRDVVNKHNDEGRKAWITEIGWCDFRRVDEKENIARRFRDFFNAVDNMPWIEVICLFRGFNLATRPECESEDNMGLFYNEYDWKTPLCPKPSAISIYRYINGENAQLDPLYKFAKYNKVRELFPNTTFGGGSNPFKVLILGNHITYQIKAPQNNITEARGLNASSSKNDYAHLIFDELKNRHENVQMTLVDMREWESTFYYDELYKDLEKFKNENPDLIIIRLGEVVGDASLNDHNYGSFFAKLVNFIRNEKSQVIITNTFKGKSIVDDFQKKVAEELNLDFVDLSELADNFSLFSKGEFLNKEYKYLPNDLGMKMIAKLIIDKIK